MNQALLFLWFALLKRQSLQFLASLRRPLRLIGFAALAAFIGTLFYYRRAGFVAEMVKPKCLLGGAFILACGSSFKGFLQRGLVFDPPDVEFLFTSPFTEKQIILYRLLPSYLFALCQGIVFGILFWPHLPHPVIAIFCMTLFQMVCFNVAAGAALLAGNIPEALHYRIRWMLLGIYAFLTLLYLRLAWDIRIFPQMSRLPMSQLLFYPAINLHETARSAFQESWRAGFLGKKMSFSRGSGRALFDLFGFALAAAGTQVLLLRFKGNLFESSVSATIRVAENTARIESARLIPPPRNEALASVRLPQLAFFQSAGAILWKNFLMARRSRRELALALIFTIIFTAPLAAMLKMYHFFLGQGVADRSGDQNGFNLGIALMLGILPFLLQRTFPFDFRSDQPHLLGYRALPFSPWGVVLAEVSVPTLLSLGYQGIGIGILLVFAHLDWDALLLIALSFPAVTLAINCVWNLYYLLSAARSELGAKPAPTAVGTLMIVALSFIIFFPAGWLSIRVGHLVVGRWMVPIAAACFLLTQYCIDLGLIAIMARLYQQFESPRDAS